MKQNSRNQLTDHLADPDTLNAFIDELQSGGNNTDLYEKLQVLRDDYTDELAQSIHDSLAIKSLEEAVTKGLELVNMVIGKLEASGIRYTLSDPWHWVGHALRDILHTGLIIGDTAMDASTITPPEAYVGFVSGALHDIWCTLVDRYADSKSLNKHAEIGGLIISKILSGLDIEENLKKAIVWWVMAHTNNRKTIVHTVNGKDFTLSPYKDTYSDETSIHFVHLARQADRLDTNGLIFVLRHLLTRFRTITDFSGGENKTQDFQTHMQLSGTPWTMLVHLEMYRSSQEEVNGVYNRHDLPAMVAIRREYSAALKDWIDGVQGNLESELIPEYAVNEHLEFLLAFMNRYVEPRIDDESEALYITALRSQFLALEPLLQRRWLTQFMKIVDAYPNYIHRLLDHNTTTRRLAALEALWQKKTIGEVLSGNLNMAPVHQKLNASEQVRTILDTENR